MSRKPYIVQQDSPNLVIVPTDTESSCEQSSEKVKLVSAVPVVPTPTPNYNGSVFAKKYAKSNFNSVNNNVLIDVSKVHKSPTSWATNYLESIGGSSTKFTRIYSAMPKSPSFRKNIQPENNTETKANNTQIPHQTKTNTETRPIIEKPKININLKHKSNSALQSPLTKEASHTNSNTNTKSYQSKMENISTNQAKIRKEPSLPKNYKIPMHSKNKPVIQLVTDKETRPNITKESCQKSQPLSSTKSNNNICELKQSKQAIRETTSNKSAQPKLDKDPNRPKLIKAIQSETNREKTYEIQPKTKKIKIRPSNENHHTTKLKYDEQIIPPRSSKETEQPIRNKENSQPKDNKETKQCTVTNETAQPNKYDPCPSKNSKEITCLKTNENITQLMSAKESYKINKKQEPTFSSKLKTKKDHVKLKSSKISKISKHSENKHSQESKPIKHKDKSLKAKEESNLPEVHLETENIVKKLKKKRSTEKESAETEVSKSKKLKTADVNTAKKENPRDVNEERLSKSISPIKSVVSKIKTDVVSRNSEKQYHKESGYQSHFEKTACTEFDYHCHNSQKSLHRDPDVDLRAKLKRKFPKRDYRKEESKRDPSKKKNKFATVAKGTPFVPEENLIISFNTKDDDDDEMETIKKSPEKKLTDEEGRPQVNGTTGLGGRKKKQSSGGNKRKKIKLEINIVFGQADTTDDESIKSNDETKDETMENMDLSFLDDFNVDEIVKSLNECKDSSKIVNNIEPLSVPDVTIQNSLSSDNQKPETALNREDNVLLNKNDIKLETGVCTEISSIENKIENQESAIQSTVNEHRSCHHEEVHSRINCDLSKIKEEVDANPEIESLQNEKSQETSRHVSMPSSEVPKANSSLRNTVRVHQKTDISIVDKPPEDNSRKLHESDSNTKINDDKHSSTSLNVEVVKKTLNNTDTALVPKLELSEKTEFTAGTGVIKSQIACSETPVANSICVNSINPDHKDQDSIPEGNSKLIINTNTTESMDMNIQSVKKNLTTSEIPTITQHSNQIEVKATVSACTQKINESPTCIKNEFDTIIIEDSDEENETEIKNNQPLKEENRKDLHLSKESPLDSSDDVIIIEPTTAQQSEPILILDTDYNIDESDDIKCQLHVKNKNDQKEASESGTVNLAEQKQEKELNAIDTVKAKVTGDNAIEIKTNATADVQSECENKSIQNQENIGTKSENTITEKQHEKYVKCKVSNQEKVANSSNSSSPKLSSGKPTEETVVPEKCTSKKATANTNTQKENTQLGTKSPNKNIPQENGGNKEVTKNDDKVERNLQYDNFIEKAETKLFFFMGRKCTVTDVIRIGKYSKIYLCKDSLKREFALKALKQECESFRPRLKEQFHKEKMLMKLQNGVPENNLNCVRMIKGFVICGLWCCLMEFYPKNLQQVFMENKKSFHIDDVQILSRQLVSAVTILRNNNIIHSDIKPSHILINAAQTRIKLCGFDQSCYIGESTLLPNTGTVNYRAPELILGYPAGYGIDVWSTALVMYEMATNKKMFTGTYNNNILFQQLCTIGCVPMEMLMGSKFRNKHFRGTAFTKVVGNSGERIVINEIRCNGRFESSVFRTYTAEWGHRRPHASRRNDKAKLTAFLELLKSMLVMHPRYRIAIEFVFANPFIYESFDNEC